MASSRHRQAACQITRAFTRMPASRTLTSMRLLCFLPRQVHILFRGIASFPTTTTVRHMSSSAFKDDKKNTTTTKTTTKTTTPSSLKSMMKPFFLKCHPDVQTTAVAKRVNLRALQTINGLLDVTTATCEGKVVEWPTGASLHVEFTIRKIETVKNDVLETTSRRRVELQLPPQSLRDTVVQTRDPGKVHSLQKQVQTELTKLFKVAGLPVPVVMLDTTTADDDDDHAIVDPMEAAWQAELDSHIIGQGHDGRTFQKSRPRSRYDQSRERFVRNMDWKRINNLYEEAVHDMEADLATEGSVRENAKRRQDVITNILSKVRVAKDIPIIEELICVRRLFLILQDNFDELCMEDMGRMWENLVIIINPERDFNTSSSAMRKRSKQQQETGYQFSYSANGVVTIHIPIDFGDEELTAELDRNLWDFHHLVGNGVEDLYPRWFTE